VRKKGPPTKHENGERITTDFKMMYTGLGVSYGVIWRLRIRSINEITSQCGNQFIHSFHSFAAISDGEPSHSFAPFIPFILIPFIPRKYGFVFGDGMAWHNRMENEDEDEDENKIRAHHHQHHCYFFSLSLLEEDICCRAFHLESRCCLSTAGDGLPFLKSLATFS